MSHQSLTSNRTEYGTAHEERAPAKLNLGLEVLSRRQDGFHDLCSVFQTVNLYDTLQVRRAESIQLTCSDADLPSGPDNLAWRAAQLYDEETGRGTAHIQLHKKIPSGAGLGGGSADAAAVLRALDRLNGNALGLPELARLGAELGSDVPFAVTGGTALVEGRGERITPVRWCQPPAWCCLLVCPPEPVSTPWAYAELDRQRGKESLSTPSPYATLVSSARGGCLDEQGLWSVLHNDFQPLIEGTKPIVARASQQLADTTPLVQSMSGSGSTVYGIYDDRAAARRAESILQATGYPVFLCTPV